MTIPTPIVRWLGRQDYQTCWNLMRQFTDARDANTPDEIWLLEHDPVFTQGQNGQPEHLLNPGTIPVIKTDRGGQITYHGPGQLMVYTLIDLKRKKLSIREFVTHLEQSVIDFLQAYHITAAAKREAPGVYVAGEKICSIGLRVRKGAAYHGIAFNINLDLSPFSCINPCGFSGLKMTHLAKLGAPSDVFTAGGELVNYLLNNLGYNGANLAFMSDYARSKQ